jgi:hypothetical protein
VGRSGYHHPRLDLKKLGEFHRSSIHIEQKASLPKRGIEKPRLAG